jgi:hypothetical protein
MSSNHQFTYELSIVMPCLNEAETLATCIRTAKNFLESSRVGRVRRVCLRRNPTKQDLACQFIVLSSKHEMSGYA